MGIGSGVEDSAGVGVGLRRKGGKEANGLCFLFFFVVLDGKNIKKVVEDTVSIVLLDPRREGKRVCY